MSQSLRTVVATPSASRGSQTVLQTDPQPESSEPSATLRLRAEPNNAPHVRWAEDVVDNEGMGKKSSKVCCIYHKPHEPGDSDSGSSSSSDSEPDLSKAQRAGGGKGKGRKDEHNHDKKGDENSKAKGKAKERRPSPNAYERQPKNK